MFIYRFVSGDADSHVYGWIAYTKEDLRVYLCQIKDDWDVREVRCRRSEMSKKWDLSGGWDVELVRCWKSEMSDFLTLLVGLDGVGHVRCRTCDMPSQIQCWSEWYDQSTFLLARKNLSHTKYFLTIIYSELVTIRLSMDNTWINCALYWMGS